MSGVASRRIAPMPRASYHGVDGRLLEFPDGSWVLLDDDGAVRCSSRDPRQFVVGLLVGFVCAGGAALLAAVARGVLP